MYYKKQVRTFHVPASLAGRITPGKRYDVIKEFESVGIIYDDISICIYVNTYGSCAQLNGNKWDVIRVHPLKIPADGIAYFLGGAIGLLLMILAGLLWLY